MRRGEDPPVRIDGAVRRAPRRPPHRVPRRRRRVDPAEWAGWTQFPDRPPIQIGGDVAHFDAGWNAAVAVLAACYDRMRTGRGQSIDVSVQESQLTLNRSRISRFANDGVLLRREGNRYAPAGMLECRDGWVQLVGIGDKQLDVLAAGDDAGDFRDPRLATTAERSEHRHLVGPALAAWCKARAKADVVDTLSALGCPSGRTPARPTCSPRNNSRTASSSPTSTTGAAARCGSLARRTDCRPRPPSPDPLLRSDPCRASVRAHRSIPADLPPGRGLRGHPHRRLHVGRRRPLRHAVCWPCSAPR